MLISDWSSDVCSSDLEDLGARGIVGRAIGELAGQAQLARRGGGLALDLAFLATAQALLHPLEHIAEQRAPAIHIVGEAMVEMVAHGLFDEARRLGRGQAVLGLALELQIGRAPGLNYRQ